ncbi:MAG: amidohydrolase [Saprospiraceae bacterium]|nr:amidohydrolase [Saprospiraceae bacterium]
MKKLLKTLFWVCAALLVPMCIFAQSRPLLDESAKKLESKVVAWRRDLHQHPELGNREFRTAEIVAKHLKSLGMEVRTGIAHTGVVGILKGGKPGPVVALRADMDGLPVTERVNIPFASKAKDTYNGQEVGVMHACGHDAHVAMLMGAAELLSNMKKDIKGTIMFIFQPAEEGPPAGEEGGAELMLKEGLFNDPKPEVVFGLHISSDLEVGKIRYKAGGTMAATDYLTIKVNGKQTHGSRPWSGVDPIVVSSQIIMGLQTIISRQTDLTQEAAVITIGKFNAGVRQNIIPEEAEMVGTIRTLDTTMQQLIHERIRRTATSIAESAGATAEVTIKRGYPVTYNNPELTKAMLPSLFNAAGEDKVLVMKPITGAEDFSFYAQKVPGLFFFLGGMPKGMDPLDAAPHHTPDFYIDEGGFVLGMKSMCQLALDYMEGVKLKP